MSSLGWELHFSSLVTENANMASTCCSATPTLSLSENEVLNAWLHAYMQLQYTKHMGWASLCVGQTMMIHLPSVPSRHLNLICIFYQLIPNHLIPVTHGWKSKHHCPWSRNVSTFQQSTTQEEHSARTQPFNIAPASCYCTFQVCI